MKNPLLINTATMSRCSTCMQLFAHLVKTSGVLGTFTSCMSMESSRCSWLACIKTTTIPHISADMDATTATDLQEPAHGRRKRGSRNMLNRPSILMLLPQPEASSIGLLFSSSIFVYLLLLLPNSLSAHTCCRHVAPILGYPLRSLRKESSWNGCN